MENKATNLDEMEVRDIIDRLTNELNRAIEYAYNINYEQLYVLNQSIIADNGRARRYMDLKFDSQAGLRNYVFGYIKDSISQKQEIFDNTKKMDDENIENISLEGFEDLKNYTLPTEKSFDNFISLFLSVYDLDNKRFERVIDFSHLDNESDQIKQFRTINDYYMDILTYFVALDSATKIVKALEDDFNDQGYKTLFYEKPLVDGVVKVDSTFVKNLSDLVKMTAKNHIKLYKSEYKKMAKSIIDDEKDSYNLISFEAASNEILELKRFNNMLVSRLKSVNLPYTEIDKAKELEKTDRYFGVSTRIDDANRDWVYVTDLELIYLKYLLVNSMVDPEKIKGLFEELNPNAESKQKI